MTRTTTNMIGFGIMQQHMSRLALAGMLAAMLLGFPARAMQPRTPVDVASLGPQVGEQVPDFSLPDQTGRLWTRDELLGPNGAVLLFHRSADW